MSLTFGRGDYRSLKCVLAANIRKAHLVYDVTEDVSTSPKLIINNSLSLWSTNAAAVYLLKLEESEELDYWLEWEAVYLSPMVHQVVLNFYNKKENEALVTSLNNMIEKLESSFLGSNPSLFPIMWCSIYPLMVSKAIKDIETSRSKLTKWFMDLSAISTYQQAVDTVFPSDPAKLLKESLNKIPVPNLVLLSSESADVDKNAGPSEEEVQAAADAWHGATYSNLPSRDSPVLPIPGRKNILITSALPYVNNVPHLGNIIGCVLSADVFSRYCRLRGYNSLYVCGTDEYGTATETKAMQEGMTPEQICHKYNALHSQVYEWFNIDFDYFGRTTTLNQTVIAQDIFWKLHKNNYISRDSVDQLKCEKCDRFLADRFVEGTCPLCAYEDARGDQCDKCGKLLNAIDLISPKCKLCKSSPIVKSSEHLFLELPKLERKLEEYLQTQYEKGTWTNNAKFITKSWLRDGLKPRCITRDLKWGTPVPLEGFTDKVFYVWFDAPIGYISITANYTDQWEKWWKNPDEVELYNFMAKDNVPFHSVIFPCTLLGADDNYTTVNHLCATEYLNYEDDKFSKSRGVGVFGDDAKTTGIPADIWRFYLLYVRPESQDSTFSWDDFVLKNNSELLNNLGNFMNRALKFVADSYAGVIPEMDVTPDDLILFAQITTELKQYIVNLERAQLREGIWHILSISRLGNQYFQSTTPWKLAKSGDAADKIRAASVVGIAANIACLLSCLIQPYMPVVSETMRDQMNITSLWKLEDKFCCYLKPGHKIGKPSPLFTKMESGLVGDFKKRFAGTQDSRNSPTKTVPTRANPDEAVKLAKMVEVQGNKVRELKAAKAEKAAIDAEVKALLQLKKELAIAEGKNPDEKPASGKKKKSAAPNAGKSIDGKASVTTSSVPVAPNAAKVEEMTQQVQQQGDKVRKLKADKADKSVIVTEVQLLLQFKRQLALAEGKDPDAAPKGKSKGKKK